MRDGWGEDDELNLSIKSVCLLAKSCKTAAPLLK